MEIRQLFKSDRIGRFARFAVPPLLGLLIFGIYYARLPYTVQTGDTGELVANAYRLEIAHPSGYPLYLWLVHFFTRSFQLGTVFHRAATLNALFSVVTVAIIAFSGKNRLFSLAAALCFALSRIFWSYSELPDVYALNCLFSAAILWLYLRQKTQPWLRTWGVTLLFAVGAANHLTIVFLAPMVLHVWLQDRKRKNVFFAGLVGALVLSTLYLSLLRMHPDSFYSWGHIQSPRQVLSHFLREDYGRTKTPARSERGTSACCQWIHEAEAADTPVQSNQIPGFQFVREVSHGIGQLAGAPFTSEFRFYGADFLRQTAVDLLPLLFVAIASLWFLRKNPTQKTLALALLLYCYVIFALDKIKPSPDGVEVSERFYLLAQILVCFAAVHGIDSFGAKGRHGGRLASILCVAALATGLLNYARYAKATDYSSNTIVEDYAINLLSEIPSGQRAVVLANDDSEYFALRYAQQVLEIRPEVFVLSAPLLFHPWHSEKIKVRDPAFQFDTRRVATRLELNLEADLIDPNIGHLSFYMPENYKTDRYKITRLPLRERLEPGKGTTFDDAPAQGFQLRSGPDAVQTPSDQYSPYLRFYSKYAYFWLAKGLAAIDRSDWEDAYHGFSEAVQRVPYCIPAFNNICILRERVSGDASQCWQQFLRLKGHFYDYYSL